MRLELTRRGDYAVRAMVALTRASDRQLTAAEIAAETGVPGSYVPQVMGDVIRSGLVANRRGRRGGYRLARAATDISLLAIVESVEGDSRRQTCVLRGGPCRRDGTCDVHDAFARAQNAWIASLASVSLADVSL